MDRQLLACLKINATSIPLKVNGKMESCMLALTPQGFANTWVLWIFGKEDKTTIEIFEIHANNEKKTRWKSSRMTSAVPCRYPYLLSLTTPEDEERLIHITCFAVMSFGSVAMVG